MSACSDPILEAIEKIENQIFRLRMAKQLREHGSDALFTRGQVEALIAVAVAQTEARFERRDRIAIAAGEAPWRHLVKS